MSETVDIAALIRELEQREPSQAVRRIETHISWVLVTDTVAYKIKKPVKFAFVDFRTREQRRHFCEEEVRLNQRLAPDIYQAVVPITYSPSTGTWAIDPPVPLEPEKAVDWAVKMRAFDANATLDRAGPLGPAQIDAVADVIARFHEQEKSLGKETRLGAPREIDRIATDNLSELRTQLPKDTRIQKIGEWTRLELKRLDSFFKLRKESGFVKECHGDLHLSNIAWEDGRPIIFDCIEFSDTLRCIDVINEVAFLFMDLCARQQSAMAWRLLNRWLERTGDYEGMEGLMFYACYRALVRAKISLHQGKQTDAENYLGLAERFTTKQAPVLTLMHGFSGSGKTVESQRLLETEGAIRIRSDVERKRLHGLAGAASSDSELQQGIYHDIATQRTFSRLGHLAETLLGAGFGVIVDATFLKRPLREQFIVLGHRMNAAVRIMDMAVSPQTCRQRILDRSRRGGDASEATLEVLEHQLQTADALTEAELALVTRPDTVTNTTKPDTH